MNDNSSQASEPLVLPLETLREIVQYIRFTPSFDQLDVWAFSLVSIAWRKATEHTEATKVADSILSPDEVWKNKLSPVRFKELLKETKRLGIDYNEKFGKYVIDIDDIRKHLLPITSVPHLGKFTFHAKSVTPMPALARPPSYQPFLFIHTEPSIQVLK
ncbi:hypothetical protein BC936DRAFT_141318 [Jimgerdemannia flammicorona]|uniref:F-box domain-containing protein n=1 Tax=Jimgerdemannia flammicorona TaxID=994334 RepID=A0A433A2G8_9FUNG|nr:hypothetical protein BC936DRAFT_141318 [Jimgerdemannia flammicorona]